MADIAVDARRRLASFENAYAVAVQLRETTGVRQLIVRTEDPARPFRVPSREPLPTETVLALVT